MIGRPASTDLALTRRLLQQARPFWLHVCGVLTLDLLATPIALLTPVPLKIAVDSVIGSEPLPSFLTPFLPSGFAPTRSALLGAAAALVVAVALLHQLQRLASRLLQTYAGEKMVLEFRSRLFRQAQRLSLAYHDSRGSTDAVLRIQYDAPAIQWVIVQGLPLLFTSSATLVAMVYVTARLDARLALVALSVAPVIVAFTRIYRRRLRAQWREVKRIESSALSAIQEVLGALRVVKAAGQEERERDRFVRKASEGLWARLRVGFAEGSVGLGITLATAAGTAAVLVIGASSVRAGTLTLGDLLIVMSYLVQLYEPLKTLGTQAANLQGALASAERALALLDQPPDVPEKPDAKPVHRARGAVEFRDVTFGYGDGPPVLHGVSFTVPPGARVGIVGVTGAGKSTMASLLARFYDPSGGAVLLDGIDLRDYRVNELRRQFSIVLQEPVLFSATVAENIAYGRPEATREDIARAAQAARAHGFIEALPDGYETLVGERGMRLSGGGRQRVALARAFLRDAPLLILDEPTSSVDVVTEAGILDTLGMLMEGRTTFLIAHRASTLIHCDRLLVLEHGVMHEADPSRPDLAAARTVS